MIKVKATTIKATSRASIKMMVAGKEQYFTVEYSEERNIEIDPKTEKSQLEKELDGVRKDLWDTCNAEVDNQIQEIYDISKK